MIEGYVLLNHSGWPLHGHHSEGVGSMLGGYPTLLLLSKTAEPLLLLDICICYLYRTEGQEKR